MKEYGVTVYPNSGNTYWYKPGTKILHRENGPACEWGNGVKEWFINDSKHREDGPAVEWNEKKEWWLDGKIYSEEQYAVEMNRRNGSCEGKVVEIDGKKYKLVEVP